MAGRRTRRGSGPPWGQIIAIGTVGVLIIGAISTITVLFLQAQRNYIPLDPKTLCPTAGIVAQTIVLLDTTDELPAVTQSQVLKRLSDVTKSIPRGGLLDIRVLNEDPTRTASIQRVCNPGDGSDIDPVTGNPTIALERWTKWFSGPVEDALAKSIGGSEQHFSPILAAVQQIAADRLSTARERSIPTEVIVVSDLLEHTEYYSHFRDGLSFETYVAKVGTRYLTDLAGAKVDFWMVQRDRKDIDPAALGEFWLRWADSSKGIGTVYRLMGM